MKKIKEYILTITYIVQETLMVVISDKYPKLKKQQMQIGILWLIAFIIIFFVTEGFGVSKEIQIKILLSSLVLAVFCSFIWSAFCILRLRDKNKEEAYVYSMDSVEKKLVVINQILLIFILFIKSIEHTMLSSDLSSFIYIFVILVLCYYIFGFLFISKRFYSEVFTKKDIKPLFSYKNYLKFTFVVVATLFVCVCYGIFDMF